MLKVKDKRDGMSAARVRNEEKERVKEREGGWM